MNYFMCKLIPPRKTFRADMSASERELMRQHGSYWNDRLIQGLVIAYGPVSDPDGSFGLVLMRLPHRENPTAAAADLCEEDPIHKANIGFTYAVYPMPAVVHHAI